MTDRHDGVQPRVAAVVDVGANTARLLVADGVSTVYEDAAYPRLGARIARDGRAGPEAIEAAAAAVAAFVEAARGHGAERVFVVVTAPARTAADAPELLARLEEAGGVPARALSEREEAEFVFAGALATEADVADPVAVCDVGGGSTELAVGTRDRGVEWVRSFPVGSSTPPSGPFLDGVAPPPVSAALASGGTARALGRLVGTELDAETLEEARQRVAAGDTADLPSERVQILPTGIAIFEEVHAVFRLPLRVARGGLREGALLRLL